MLFFKRTVPLIITFFTGILVILAFFSGPAMPVKGLDEKVTEWAQIIMTFTMVLGAISLFQINLFKIQAKREGWQFNVVLLTGFFVMAILSFLHGIQTNVVKGGTYYQVNTNKQYVVVDFKKEENGSEGAALVKSDTDNEPIEMATSNLRGSFDHLVDKWWKFFFDGVFKAANATMFSLLAFFVASASFRAFKVKSREAALLMGAAFLVMIGNVPVGHSLSAFLSWFLWPVLIVLTKIIQVIGGIFQLPVTTEVLTVDLSAMKEWIMKVPSSAAQSAILIGATLGYISASLKVILGVERSYLGGEK